jgi:hypothetical protein
MRSVMAHPCIGSSCSARRTSISRACPARRSLRSLFTDSPFEGQPIFLSTIKGRLRLAAGACKDSGASSSGVQRSTAPAPFAACIPRQRGGLSIRERPPVRRQASLRAGSVWACSTGSRLRSLALAAGATLTRSARAHPMAFVGARRNGPIRDVSESDLSVTNGQRSLADILPVAAAAARVRGHGNGRGMLGERKVRRVAVVSWSDLHADRDI